MRLYPGVSAKGEENPLQVLSEDGEQIFCRTRRVDGDGIVRSVLAVRLTSEEPLPASIDRLVREYELKDDLDSSWAVRPLGLVRDRAETVLLLEDPGGEPLGRLIGRPLELAKFLQLAIALSAALGRLHERGLIHKDVKPANVLVNPATGQVWLTGFGITSRLPRERQSPEPPEFIAGTLAYMAPEQTGRMNRSLDSRSDLYSLGATLYEMLTGRLPFTASDPMEWVHCHIARQADSPCELVGEIPQVLSSIVLKLLAKTAEERYQTAAGVEADLRRCLAEWQSHGRIDPFPLGTCDASDRFLMPERLYGREREIETLLASFDRVVAQGTPELVLVSGYSGVGKSSVVNELHKVLVPPRGLFAAGKFDQYKRDIPYTTIAQAIQILVRQILVKSETELDQWRCALAEAVGPFGQLIVNLVPELEFIIGKQPSVPDLPPQDAQNRFQLVFRRFLGAFAKPDHPLALFLDDLQWLDAATLDLLEHLVTHSEMRHLLLVGAYRDNEVSPAHPLLQKLEAIRQAGGRIREIVLAPLGLDDVGRLVADALLCEPERARPLARVVQKKTGGNPFFAIQFCTALFEEGLFTFDPVRRVWQWDMGRIGARSYTDNVVDLVAWKLKRFSANTQEALKRFACLGNAAEIATLVLSYGETDEDLHSALWEAARAGLVVRQETIYKFLHDRIQQAAYSLIPVEQCAEAHLRIGRVLLASMTADQLAKNLFDVANQLNRGASLLTDRDEKTQLATIDLRAGRKAKASAAYASGRAYFAAGMALLDERNWGSDYELMFGLWLERAECEFLTGSFDIAESLIAELLQRAISKVDQAAVYNLKVQLHIVKSENQQAVDSTLACLRLFGIDMPAHPTWQQVEEEYNTIWQTLAGRPIEGLIDLPAMTDPELQAAMRVLTVLISPAYFTDFNLYCLHVCRMVNISVQHGTSGASAHAYGYFGFILGPVFHRYGDAESFATLASNLIKMQGFNAGQAKVYYAIATVAFWTQSVANAIDLSREGFRTAIETGDLSFACYCLQQTVNGLLLRNDPLAAVRSESESAVSFTREAKYDELANMLMSQERFIAAMQGRTASFPAFSDAQFDEATFEAGLTRDRLTLMVSFYWILKLRARYLSGDYAEALAAADKVEPLVSGTIGHIQLLDYFFYAALTVAQCYESAPADKQQKWRALLAAHQEQLREWTEIHSPTFADKHALVMGEIARLEGRDLDAMRLYEQAIRSAHDHGFVQTEGVAYEVAARFYAARSLKTSADAHLRNARYCYLRWGADGKVKQLDQLYPRLIATEGHSPTATIGSPVEHLDIASVVKASQAVSSEILLPKLVERLMKIALENAGADRGLLILSAENDHLIRAEAQATGDRVNVAPCQKPITGINCPESLIRYVIRTHECVILDDASEPNLFSGDDYLRGRKSRSILCFPLIKQRELTGILFLENTLTSRAFTPDRIAVLELLAAQAAISLENTRLYSDLQEREAKVRRLVDSNIIGIFIWREDGQIIDANDAFLRIVEYDRDDLVSGRLSWKHLTPAEWSHMSDRRLADLKATGTAQPYEKMYFRKNGSRVPVLVGGARFEDGKDEGVAFVLDLTSSKKVEEAARESERRYRTVQMEMAHANRVAAIGQLSSSIAHEINQPLSGVITNAETASLWLQAQTPNVGQALAALARTVRDGRRINDVISRIRAMMKKAPAQKDKVDINEAILEVIGLTHGEALKNGVVVQSQFGEGLPVIEGDKVQLQQVILNLTMNAIEAMSAVDGGPKEILISTAKTEPNGIVVRVVDSGPGLDPADVESIFNAFYTTKASGMGMGLSICRSIVEAHGGRLWATPAPRGAVFQFTLPAERGRPGAC